MLKTHLPLVTMLFITAVSVNAENISSTSDNAIAEHLFWFIVTAVVVLCSIKHVSGNNMKNVLYKHYIWKYIVYSILHNKILLDLDFALLT